MMNAPAYDGQNVFARVLRGELPSHKVFEDEHVIAIMDVMPQANGHTLVIPKTPSRNLLDIGAEDLANLIRATQRVARAVKAAFEADGVTVAQYSESAAGQTVFHTHVHVIPRYEGVPLRRHGGAMEDGKILADNAAKVRAALAAAT
jgi:histidine triad (HIT) family protein